MDNVPVLNPSPTLKPDVGMPCAGYQSMISDWQLIDDLMGGTRAMRVAGERWLPREPGETYPGYLARINRTFLFNGLKRTVRTLVGKPFSEDCHISKAIDSVMAEYLSDCDKLGHDMTGFANKLTQIGLAKGIVHILVDAPYVQGRITLEQKTALGIRPYMVAVDPEQLIGWQYVMEGGTPILSQIRIAEVVTVPDGDFGEATIKRVRVFDRITVDGQSLVAFRLFELRPDPTNQLGKKWVLIEQGETSTSKIPLVTAVFGEEREFFTVTPPLMDLAWMNVEHWQSSSDQRHVLHVARVPVWFLKGWDPVDDEDGNPKDKIELGPDRMIRLTSESADMKIVEHTGKAIEAGRTDLKDIEAKMAILGTELLSQKTKGEKSATEEQHDNKAEDSDLAQLVKKLEDALTLAINFMYEWEGREAPKGKLLTINTDFGLTAQDASDLQTLYQSRMAGQISHETYLKELQRRGVLAPSVDLDQEKTLSDKQGPVIIPTGNELAGPGRKATEPVTGDAAIKNKAGAGA